MVETPIFYLKIKYFPAVTYMAVGIISFVVLGILYN